MALLHVPPATDAAEADGDRALPSDEIIDLTDRRRVFLHALFGLAVDSATADAVFTAPEPPMAVEDGTITVGDA